MRLLKSINDSVSGSNTRRIFTITKRMKSQIVQSEDHRNNENSITSLSVHRRDGHINVIAFLCISRKYNFFNLAPKCV